MNKKEAHGYMNSLEYENLLENKTHADPMFPYNTYLCSIPLDFNSVSLHWHEFMEIIYIKKGKGNVTVDFTTHYVEEGDIVIILPGHIHGISQHEGYVQIQKSRLTGQRVFPASAGGRRGYQEYL